MVHLEHPQAGDGIGIAVRERVEASPQHHVLTDASLDCSRQFVLCVAATHGDEWPERRYRAPSEAGPHRGLRLGADDPQSKRVVEDLWLIQELVGRPQIGRRLRRAARLALGQQRRRRALRQGAPTTHGERAHHESMQECAPPYVPSHASGRPGSVKVNVEPAPSWLWTQIRPPCSSTNFRDRAKPSPVPSTFLSAVPTCRNSSKIASWSSGAMPTPVSLTDTSMDPSPALARTSIRPSSGVNFMAFDSRFSNTCLIFRSSPRIWPSPSSAAW